MNSNYKITFNGITTEHVFEDDDQAFDEAEKCTDTAALPTVEKKFASGWHFWDNIQQEWIPNGSTKVYVTIFVEGWLPPTGYQLKPELRETPEKPIIRMKGLHPLLGVSAKVTECDINSKKNR